MKKPGNLKKRLAEIRQEPAPPVDLTLRLDAELYQALKVLARKRRQPLQTYLVSILQQHTSDDGQ